MSVICLSSDDECEVINLESDAEDEDCSKQIYKGVGDEKGDLKANYSKHGKTQPDLTLEKLFINDFQDSCKNDIKVQSSVNCNYTEEEEEKIFTNQVLDVFNQALKESEDKYLISDQHQPDQSLEEDDCIIIKEDNVINNNPLPSLCTVSDEIHQNLKNSKIKLLAQQLSEVLGKGDITNKSSLESGNKFPEKLTNIEQIILDVSHGIYSVDSDSLCLPLDKTMIKNRRKYQKKKCLPKTKKYVPTITTSISKLATSTLPNLELTNHGEKHLDITSETYSVGNSSICHPLEKNVVKKRRCQKRKLPQNTKNYLNPENSVIPNLNRETNSESITEVVLSSNKRPYRRRNKKKIHSQIDNKDLSQEVIRINSVLSNSEENILEMTIRKTFCSSKTDKQIFTQSNQNLTKNTFQNKKSKVMNYVCQPYTEQNVTLQALKTDLSLEKTVRSKSVVQGTTDLLLQQKKEVLQEIKLKDIEKSRRNNKSAQNNNCSQKIQNLNTNTFLKTNCKIPSLKHDCEKIYQEENKSSIILKRSKRNIHRKRRYLNSQQLKLKNTNPKMKSPLKDPVNTPENLSHECVQLLSPSNQSRNIVINNGSSDVTTAKTVIPKESNLVDLKLKETSTHSISQALEVETENAVPMELLQTVNHSKETSLVCEELLREQCNEIGTKTVFNINALVSCSPSEIVQLKSDFIKNYNNIFNSDMENTCSKMGDLLLLAIKDTQNFKSGTKDTKENMNYQDSLKQYRSNFMCYFYKLYRNVDSYKFNFKQNKSVMIAWFLKMFLQVTCMWPEFSDSLQEVRINLISLLPWKIKNLPVLSSIFFCDETEFELDCWLILGFIQDCIDTNKQPVPTGNEENTKKSSTTDKTKSEENLDMLQFSKNLPITDHYLIQGEQCGEKVIETDDLNIGNANEECLTESIKLDTGLPSKLTVSLVKSINEISVIKNNKQLNNYNNLTITSRSDKTQITTRPTFQTEKNNLSRTTKSIQHELLQPNDTNCSFEKPEVAQITKSPISQATHQNNDSQTSEGVQHESLQQIDTNFNFEKPEVAQITKSPISQATHQTNFSKTTGTVHHELLKHNDTNCSFVKPEETQIIKVPIFQSPHKDNLNKTTENVHHELLQHNDTDCSFKKPEETQIVQAPSSQSALQNNHSKTTVIVHHESLQHNDTDCSFETPKGTQFTKKPISQLAHENNHSKTIESAQHESLQHNNSFEKPEGTQIITTHLSQTVNENNVNNVSGGVLQELSTIPPVSISTELLRNYLEYEQNLRTKNKTLHTIPDRKYNLDLKETPATEINEETRLHAKKQVHPNFDNISNKVVKDDCTQITHNSNVVYSKIQHPIPNIQPSNPTSTEVLKKTEAKNECQSYKNLAVYNDLQYNTKKTTSYSVNHQNSYSNSAVEITRHITPTVQRNGPPSYETHMKSYSAPFRPPYPRMYRPLPYSQYSPEKHYKRHLNTTEDHFRYQLQQQYRQNFKHSMAHANNPNYNSRLSSGVYDKPQFTNDVKSMPNTVNQSCSAQPPNQTIHNIHTNTGVTINNYNVTSYIPSSNYIDQNPRSKSNTFQKVTTNSNSTKSFDLPGHTNSGQVIRMGTTQYNTQKKTLHYHPQFGYYHS